MSDRWGVYLSIYFKSLFTNVKFWNNYCKALALDFKHYECKLMRHVLSFLEKKIIFWGESQENYTEQTNVHCICNVL